MEVTRASVDVSRCPDLAASLRLFKTELTTALARLGKTDLAKPADLYRSVAPDGIETFITDGPSFAIQVTDYAATAVLKPDIGSEPPLLKATARIYSAVQPCAARADTSTSVVDL